MNQEKDAFGYINLARYEVTGEEETLPGLPPPRRRDRREFFADERPHNRKEDWGPGPWHDEPDRQEWILAAAPGIALLALRNMSDGHWCGYVGVPAGHAWFGKTVAFLGMEEWTPHQGISWAKDYAPDHSAQKTRGLWWVGFHCAHCGDDMPVVPRDSRVTRKSEYRSLDFVAAEVERMAVLAHRVTRAMEACRAEPV